MMWWRRPICWLRGHQPDNVYIPELWRPRLSNGEPVPWCLRCRRYLTPS